jgi:hypothetical protein
MPSPAIEQFLVLLAEITSKSKSNGIKWSRVFDTSTEFYAEFPGTRLAIEFHSPRVGADYFAAMLSRQGDPDPVLQLHAEDGDEPVWSLLSDLYEEARRLATGWDEAIASTRAAVKAGQPGVGHDDDIRSDQAPSSTGASRS